MNAMLGDVPRVSVSRPQEVSVFLLIIWIFALTQKVDQDLKQRMRAMYGNSSSAMDPITPTIEAFCKVMQAIRSQNKKCVVKVIVDDQLSKHILKMASKDPQIIGVYLFSPTGDIQHHLPRTYSTINQPNHNYLLLEQQKQQEEQQNLFQGRTEIIPRGNKVAKVVLSLEDAVTQAEKQVQAFTKSFRTFENSQCLTDDFDRINLYRFRLIAFLNLKISDYSQSLANFKKFVYEVLPQLNGHLIGMGRRSIKSPNLMIDFDNYYSAAAKWIQCEQVEANKVQKDAASAEKKDNLTESREAFYHQILSIYQGEGFFCHLINSHLKMIDQLNSDWRSLSLPFSHLHRAIKYFYKEGLQTDPQFYCKPFTVYRSGRSRKSELNRYMNLANIGGAFVEFFGFLSTSLSAKFVVDYLVSLRNSRDSGRQKEQDDQQIIFRIVVDPSPLKQAAKFDFLINGFFKMSQKQRKGNKEKQVLFNSLNIFRLLKVQKMKVFDLFSEEEKQQIDQKSRSFAYLYNYSLQAVQLRFYDTQITVVDLQFGSFYRVLLTPNPFDLTDHDRAAKENIVYFMNRVNRYHMFDFGDACELSNDHQGAYNYWKSKVGEGEDLFKCSKTDNKNYFERLSSVCSKLGRVKEALTYSRIAVECCLQLESIHLNEAYNKHYQRLYEMQKNSIEIYRETSNFTAAEKQLKAQLHKIRSRNFQEPQAKMRASEVYINQAINFYSMGKLEECQNRFIKCERQLNKTIADFSLQQPQQCYFSDFLKQIINPHPRLISRRLNYCSFAKDLYQLKRKEHQEMLVRKHGPIKDLIKTCQLATSLLGVAQKAIANRNSLFQSRRKYVQFVSHFSQQFSLSLQALQRQDDKLAQVEEKIRKSIIEVSSLDQEDTKYGEQLAHLNELIQQFNQLDRSNLSSSSDSSTWEFIKKFKQGERDRKIRRLEAKKETVLNENRQQLVESYLKCAAEIEQAIDELQSQGYVGSSIPILQMRLQRSRIFQQCDDRAAAMCEIEKIINGGVVQGQDRYTELAHAYSVRGNIQMQLGQVQLAVSSFNEALRCFPKNVAEDIEEELLDVSVITESPQEPQLNSTQKKDLQLKHNNEYLQARISRVKALLMWVEIKTRRQNAVPINVFNHPQSELPWQERHSSEHMLTIQIQVSQIRDILTPRSTLQNMSNLQSQLLEAETYYYLNMPPSQKNLTYAFSCLSECMTLRNKQMGNRNMKNALMCCNLINRHSSRRDVVSRFQELKLTNCLRKAKADIQNCTFAWKIQFSFFLLVSSRESERSSSAISHLQCAIQLLQTQLANQHEHLLEKELHQLKSRLAVITGDHHSQNQESRIEIVATQQPRPQELIYGQTMTIVSNENIQQISTQRNLNSSNNSIMLVAGRSSRIRNMFRSSLQNTEMGSSLRSSTALLQRYYWRSGSRIRADSLINQ